MVSALYILSSYNKCKYFIPNSEMKLNAHEIICTGDEKLILETDFSLIITHFYS